ncbi:reverse transcriptase domain-containing protein [Tanacetum coccineum]
MELVGFFKEQLILMGKIELSVMFGSEGSCRRTMIKFTVVRASSPYKIILGRTSMKELRAISSTTHAMMKFPTPRGGHASSSDNCYFRVSTARRKASDPREKARRRSMVLDPEKNKAVMKEVKEWVKASIVRPVWYLTWISNPMLVKKVDGTWRMCIGFKNVNLASPKDYYPLLEINLNIEANAGATYQRMVDSAFQAQLGQNLEAYVDNMVIKSMTKQEMIMDVAETFGRNQKEGKFLSYMVTSEGIKANPKKTKAVADMQSLKTLKEMQNLSGKLAELNRFLSRSAARALPFFKTLKNITKEIKDDYQWTKDAERLKETLYVYHVASKDAVSRVLVTDCKGKQTPIRYVSRTLHEADKNYAPLEKLALCLLHLSRRLRKYFEAHPIKIAEKIKARALKVKVDSKLVSCQLNKEFVASSKGMTRGRNLDSGQKRGKNTPDEDKPIRNRRRSRVQKVMMLRCVGPLQANDIIREVHEGVCRIHAEARSVVAKIMRQGYYWPSMHRDTKEVVDKCDSFQIHALVPRLPKTRLTSIIFPWPFYQWGLDILGPFPEGPEKLKFIIVAIDYFTKLMEAKTLAKTTGKEVLKFVWENIMCT